MYNIVVDMILNIINIICFRVHLKVNQLSQAHFFDYSFSRGNTNRSNSTLLCGLDKCLKIKISSVAYLILFYYVK